MKRDAEDADLWMGYKDDFNLKKTRRFVDRLSAITALCVKASNRVLDFGKEEENIPNEKNKNSNQEKADEDEFEFLNVSELQEQWDNEDKKVLNDTEIIHS